VRFRPAVQLPAVLVGDGRDVHHAPDLALAAVIAAQEVDELGRVNRVGLGVLVPAVDLDGAGVHDNVVDPSTRQGAVQPEAIAARLVAGADRRVAGQAEALLGLGDLLVQPAQVARRDRAQAGPFGRLGGTGHQPLVLAEFQGDVQRPRRGRGHGSFSVFKETGVLPDGDLYHLGYLAAYMVSNDASVDVTSAD
jgi:hypothetical protein